MPRWGDAAPFWLDVAAFEDALHRATGLLETDETTALREAIDLYRRDLLEGHYDDWILGERERLNQRYLDALRPRSASRRAYSAPIPSEAPTTMAQGP